MVNSLANVALEFEGWSDDIVFNAEWLQGQVNCFGDFELVEFAKLAQSLDIVNDDLLEGVVLLSKHCLRVFAVGGGPLLELFRVANNDSHGAILQRIAVDHALQDIVGLNEDVFELLRRDILALRKLQNVFAAVNDLNRAVWINDGNIT